MRHLLVLRAAVVCCAAVTAASGSLILWMPPSAAASPSLPSMRHCKAELHKSASDSHFDVWTCGASPGSQLRRQEGTGSRQQGLRR